MILRRLAILGVAVLPAAPAAAAPYATSTGETVEIAGFPEVAPAYAEFFAGLPHGAELAELRVTIVPPEEVPALCGAGMTACYVPRESTLVAPGPEFDGPLLAHEYGHHVAANRGGGVFSSVLMGPPRWASHAHVCAKLRDSTVGIGWGNEPAEAWADVYARLTYPELPWRLTPALSPDDGAFLAALRDVVAPPPALRTLAFRGRFDERERDVRRFTVPVRLDGAVDLELEGQRSLRLEVRAAVGARRSRSSRTRRLRVKVCRAPGERVEVSVTRRSGTGPFTLRARLRG